MDKRGGWSTEENRPERNLIDVSKDDDSDSEEVSDSDEEEHIRINRIQYESEEKQNDYTDEELEHMEIQTIHALVYEDERYKHFDKEKEDEEAEDVVEAEEGEGEDEV